MIRILSFGFKYGAPKDIDAANIIDCRPLPNPHGRTDLRELTGKHEKVREFVKRGQNYLTQLNDGVDRVMRGQKTVAFGCVGGRHRSVALAEIAGEALTALGFEVEVSHRELD